MNRYFKTYVVTQNMLDVNQKLSVTAILDIAQDISARHTKQMGVGFYELINKDIAWILLKSKVEILSYPEYEEDLYVETWPLKPGRIDLKRNILIKNNKGDVLIKVIQKWILFNIKNRNIVPTKYVNELLDIYDDETIFDNSFDKINEVACPILENTKVLPTQIDCNVHLNNTRYIDIFYNVLYNHIDDFKNRLIRSIEIEYKKENKLDDILSIAAVKINKDEIYCEIKNKNDETSSKAKIILFE